MEDHFRVAQDGVAAVGIGHVLDGFAGEKVDGDAEDFAHVVGHGEEGESGIAEESGEEIDVAAAPSFAAGN
jgi:hypothetical protein